MSQSHWCIYVLYICLVYTATERERGRGEGRKGGSERRRDGGTEGGNYRVLRYDSIMHDDIIKIVCYFTTVWSAIVS
jgi:hypothetical protein